MQRCGPFLRVPFSCVTDMRARHACQRNLSLHCELLVCNKLVHHLGTFQNSRVHTQAAEVQQYAKPCCRICQGLRGRRSCVQSKSCQPKCGTAYLPYRHICCLVPSGRTYAPFSAAMQQLHQQQPIVAADLHLQLSIARGVESSLLVFIGFAIKPWYAC